MKTKYKYIYFQQHENSLWEIKNNKSKGTLGYIEYYPTWKQYVFTTETTTAVFNISCLLDIVDFIKQLSNSN